MESPRIIRRLLSLPVSTRAFYPFPRASPLQPRLRSPLAHTVRTYASESSLPRVVQPSLWQGLIPKPFRRDADGKRPVSKLWSTDEWNPATIYIVLGLLVGSQAINLMMLRKEYATFSRHVEAKIALLKEVIERANKGEQVDVEGLLGTGDAAKEKEWEEVLKEIEKEDYMRSRSLRRERKEQEAAEAKAETPAAADSQEAHIAEPVKTSGARFF